MSDQIQQLREELESLNHTSASNNSYTDLELDSYLKFQRSIPAAAKALIASEQWRLDHPVSIADVAPFIRAPPGGQTMLPSACLVCLEDGQGGVARDEQQRPIILMMGVLYGTEEELQQQVAYALQRASKYRLPHQRPDEVCFVTEVQSRETKSLSSSFRIPDGPVRSLFDFMKSKYPGSQLSVVHFCGLPRVVASCFKMVRPFVSDELWSRLKLKSSFAHLKAGNHVAPSSLLPEWDKEGTFSFDLDEYVEWRAQEEGISLDQICPRGQGRKYNGIFSFAPPSLTMENIMGTAEKQDGVIQEGWVEKQGSGLGLFSSNRWKSKYMILQPGLLVYFESSKISSTNVASKWIPIDHSSTVEQVTLDDKKEGVAGLCFQSVGREYIFGFKNEQESDDWLLALRQQCHGSDSSSLSSSDDDEEQEGAPTAMIGPPVSPAKVSSLCVGDFRFEQDRRLLATLRPQ